jgi:ABC-type sugar transport system permease subunit
MISEKGQRTHWRGRLRHAALSRRRVRSRQGGRPFAYLLPAFAVYAMFFLWPASQLVRLSLFRWDGVTPRQSVGIDNYTQLASDPLLLVALRNTVMWTVAAIIVPVVVGLALAVFLSRSKMFGKTLFRTLFFMPQVLSTVVVAVLWGWIYNPSFGALNNTLRSIGLDGLAQGWLGESSLALWALFVAWSWTQYGFAMIIFIAAIDDIDETHFEAASIDGATVWQQTRYVLVPAIKGPVTTVLLIMAITAFQMFDLVLLVTDGGPGRATSVLAHYMYEVAFRFRRVGYGAAVGVMLMALILVLTIGIIKVRNAFEEDVA